MNKAEYAIATLREAASALENLPSTFRRTSIMRPAVTPENLRIEALHIEQLVDALKEGMEAINVVE